MKRKKFIIGSLLFLLLAVIIPATLWMVSARSATTSLNVTVQEAKVLVSEGAYLLDVRTQDEWDGAHVPGAVLIPLGELENRTDEIPTGTMIVVMCRSGNRSLQGRDILIEAGFENVYSMYGGINEWVKVGFDVE